MLKKENILNETDSRLRLISDEIIFPLSKKDLNLIDDMINYLKNNQNDSNPVLAISASQLGVLKRYFVVIDENEKQQEIYVIINPKIIKKSLRKIYNRNGEECLSINRKINGVALRYAKIEVEFFDINGNKNKMIVTRKLSIIFQHEIDHLNGILFSDIAKSKLKVFIFYIFKILLSFSFLTLFIILIIYLMR